MTEYPLPSRLSEPLRLSGPASRSLVFDRGFDGFRIADGTTSISSTAKRDFLAAFRDRFGEPADFRAFLTRRRAALEALGTVTVALVTQTRLVSGLGLPHPTATGLLLDRLTGSPYLPGSTVKGLLRASAGLVAAGDLKTDNQEDQTFWEVHRGAVFGPDRSSPEPARGQVIFFDAFPTRWPDLQLDVLTPHQQPYYAKDDGSAAPGDWHDPVPVAFLTVAQGTSFEFHFRLRPLPATPDGAGLEPQSAASALSRLLPVALAGLGIGGKKSSGYGVFGDGAPPRAEIIDPPRSPSRPDRYNGGPRRQRPAAEPAVPPSDTPGDTVWKDAALELRQGTPTIHRGTQIAMCGKDDLPSKILQQLKKTKTLRVDADVVKLGGGRWRIAAVRVQK